MSRLSGGEQARVLIARLMLRPADILLLDEPTNDLDLQSLEVLENSMMEFPGALVLVTHDRYLLERVSQRILALDGKGNANFYADLSQWEAAREESDSLGAMHPVMQAVTLTVLAARWQGLDPGYAQEIALSGFARASQRRVVSLESPELQMAALIPREATDAERLVAQLLEQWIWRSARHHPGLAAGSGDLAELMNAGSDDDRRRLNDERNPTLADAIETCTAPKVFVPSAPAIRPRHAQRCSSALHGRADHLAGCLSQRPLTTNKEPA
jgi:energy-coupling factor transporter ATP-binding protein EcfA2